jgi:diguanylate cyclase (GGDEF)-like protein
MKIPLTPALSPSSPDPGLLQRLAWFEYFFAAVVTLTAALSLAAPHIPRLSHLPPALAPMNFQTALAALLTALSLGLSQPRQAGGMTRVMLKLSGRKFKLSVMLAGMLVRVSLMLAGVVAVVAADVLLSSFLHISLRLGPVAPYGGPAAVGSMSPETATAFLLLALVMILMQESAGFASHLADLCITCVCFIVLIETTRSVFGALHFFNLPLFDRNAPVTVCCLILLAFTALTRRAENGAFTIFLGNGVGSTIARFAAPAVLLFPILWELARAYSLQSGIALAGDASTAAIGLTAALGMALLLILTVRLNHLERQIRELSLRDELTGLYNSRGFHLFAWQALRLAHRSSLPFSVLFIDLDNINEVSESQGHEGTRKFLLEMADLLRTAFRETDVLGRIGADEFAVAGHFNEKSISLMVLRIQEAANFRNELPGRSFFLAFSINSVTADDPRHDSLEDLLAAAGKTISQDTGALKPIEA